MEHISKIIPEAIKDLPAPSNDNSESQTSNDPNRSQNSLLTKERGNLETRWQRIHIGLEKISPGVQVMASEVERWCWRVREHNSSSKLICLAGIFGCGKTQIMRGAARYVNAIYMQVWPAKWPHPISSSFVRWPEFVREVSNDNREHFEDVVQSDVVFLDDIGAEEDQYKSGTPNRILGDLLGRLEEKYVFINTNIAPDGWKARWDGRVEDRLLRKNSVIVNGYDPELACVSYAQWKLQNP